MASLLLAVIYAAFISLGLPDSMLGSAWPTMYGTLEVPFTYAGIISMIIATGTIVSSLFSTKLIGKLGTGALTAISVALTAGGLFGFSISRSFLLLCLFAIPYGLGAGSVDAALNNYVALHYSARHMSWLHCFWGVGATAGPYIMGLCLSGGGAWFDGYRTVGIIQICLVALLAASIPLWKKTVGGSEEKSAAIGISGAVKLPGAVFALFAFFCYCALESTAGLWASSYMSLSLGASGDDAAKIGSLFFLGITGGRLLSGFVATRVGDRNMIRAGQALASVGIIILLISKSTALASAGLLVVGLGCAPIYPCIIHSTPFVFGRENSQALIGIQMASAYLGSTLMPPFFGFLAGKIGMGLYPWYLLFFAALMIVVYAMLNKKRHLDV